MPIRKHAVGVGRGWKPISFFTAQPPRCASSLVPCPTLISSFIPYTPPPLLPSHSSLHTHFPRLCPNQSVSTQQAKFTTKKTTEVTPALLIKKVRQILNVRGLNTVLHKAAGVRVQQWRSGWEERGGIIGCRGKCGLRGYYYGNLFWYWYILGVLS